MKALIVAVLILILGVVLSIGCITVECLDSRKNYKK